MPFPWTSQPTAQRLLFATHPVAHRSSCDIISHILPVYAPKVPCQSWLWQGMPAALRFAVWSVNPQPTPRWSVLTDPSYRGPCVEHPRIIFRSLPGLGVSGTIDSKADHPCEGLCCDSYLAYSLLLQYWTYKQLVRSIIAGLGCSMNTWQKIMM